MRNTVPGSVHISATSLSGTSITQLVTDYLLIRKMANSKLPPGIFQQGIQMQKWLLSRIVWYFCIVYLVTLVLFALLRLFTGVSIKRIGYFCVRHISWSPKQGVEVRIGRLGLKPHRPTVAEPGYVTFVLDNLEIVVDPSEIMKDKDASRPTEEPVTKEDDSSEEKSDEKEEDDINCEFLDGIPLIPTKNKRVFRFLRWLLPRIDVFNFVIHSLSHVLVNVNTTVCTSAQIFVDLRKTRNLKASNFFGTLDGHQLKGDEEVPVNVKIGFTDMYTAESLVDESPWQMLDDLRVDLTGVINLTDMKLKNVGSHIHAGRVQVDASFAREILNKIKAYRSYKSENDSLEQFVNADFTDPGKLFSPEDQRRLIKISKILLHLVNRTQIAVGFVEVFKVPASCGADSSVVYLAASVKNVILNLSRMNPLSSGFRLLYEENDIAHQAIFTAASLNISLDNGFVQEEILYIPLITNLSRGNIFSKTLHFAQEVAGSYNQSTLRSRWTIHAPNVSVEYRQVPSLVRLILGDPLSEKPPAARKADIEMTLVKLQDYLPKLDLEVVVSDPALRAVCGQDNSDDRMFVAEAERLDFSLRASHGSDIHGYSAQSSFTCCHMSTYYCSSRIKKSYIAKTDSTEFNLTAKTAPKLEVEISGRQDGFYVSATQYEIFHSIGLFNEAIKNSLLLYKHYSTHVVKSSGPKHPSFTREIPAWLKSVDLSLERTSITIASNKFRRHTNEVLGVKVTAELFSLRYFNEPPTQYSTDGRLFLVSGQNLLVAKADRTLIEGKQDVANRIVELPKMVCSLNTHDFNCSSIFYSIHPKLRVDLNINLILAFEVVREVLDVALAKVGTKARAPKKDPPTSKEPGNMARTDYTYLIQVESPLMLVTIDMPSDDKVMLEIVNGYVEIKNLHSSLKCHALRLYSESPFQKGSWCIIMSLIGLTGSFDSHELGPDNEVIMLDLERFKINVPYEFKLYRIVDNGITLAKSIKTLLKQTAMHNPDIVFDPKKIENIPHIPRTRIKAKEIVTSLEDDHFESELQLSMATKMHTHSHQQRKVEQFGTRLKQLLRKGRDLSAKYEKDTQTHSRTNSSTNGNRSASSSSSPSTGADLEHTIVQVVHKTTQVFGEHHDKGVDVPLSPSDRALVRAIAFARVNSKHRNVIDDLLESKIELGVVGNDSKRVASGHPWLEFWAMDAFAPLRELKMPLANGEPGKLTLAEAREALNADISRAWVDTIRSAKLTQMEGARVRATEFVDDQMNPQTCIEERIVDYSSKPLLMNISLRDVTLSVDTTEYNTQDKLHKFLHEIGKGQPMDTEFSILVPFLLDLRAQGGLRVDVRDYPLPLMNFPPLAPDQDANEKMALRIHGNVVISEQLVHNAHSIRHLFIPLKPGMKPDTIKHRDGNTDILEVRRTLTPIKTFTDLKFKCESTLPTRLAWCMAYKPGFSAVGQAFSGFSKPPIDPSPALGFWDKIRLVFHARMSFYLPKSPLLLILKCGKSPYSLLGEDSGFVFAWRDEVNVLVNPDDNPKHLFLVDSDSYELYVPRFAASETNYLKSSPAQRAFPQPVPAFTNASIEKIVFSFAQPTRWKLGMMFEKESTGGTRDMDFRHHYDVELSMPQFIDDVETYDAYEGFRSDFIHMSISVISQAGITTDSNSRTEFNVDPMANIRGDSRCSAHLTAGVFHHFKCWKSQFHSDLWSPIRTGSLFPDPVRARPSTKTFGAALSTAQYQIALAPLDLSFFHHMYHQTASANEDRCTGVKAKVQDFVFDWHTRREPPNGLLSSKSGHRRWRMKSYSAEVDLRRVTMRVVDAKMHVESSIDLLKELGGDDRNQDDIFDDDDDDDDEDDDPDDYETESTDTNLHDTDARARNNATFAQYMDPRGRPRFGPRYIKGNVWADLDDYTEIGTQINSTKAPSVTAVPFLDSPRIFYLRKTDFSQDKYFRNPDNDDVVVKFYNPGVHECLMSHTAAEETQAAILSYRIQSLKQKVDGIRSLIESKPDDDPEQKELQIMHDAGLHGVEVLEKEKSILEIVEHRPVLDDDFGTDANANVCKHKNPESSSKKMKCDLDFTNTYNIHAVHLKWNNTIRNLMYRLQTSLQEDHELEYVQCRRAVQYLEELVEKVGNDRTTQERVPPPYDPAPAESNDVEYQVEKFFESLGTVDDLKKAKSAHLIKFFSPQVQLVAEENKEQCVQLLAKEIELQVIDVFVKDELDEADANSSRTERRYGFVLRNAAFYSMSVQDIEESGMEVMCLDNFANSDDHQLWPPWLAVELCYDSFLLRQFMIVKDVSFSVRYDQPNDLHVADSSEEVKEDASPDSPSRVSLDSSANSTINSDSEPDSLTATLILHAPQLVVSMDSEQFCSLYAIAVDLLSYRDPLIAKREKAINKVFLSTDFSGDYQATLRKIENLQANIKALDDLRSEISLYSLTSHDVSAKDAQMFYLKLSRKHNMLRTRLTVLIRAFKTSLRRHMRTAETKRSKWLLKLNSLVLQILDNDGSEIAELILKSLKYSRLTNGDSGCANKFMLDGVYGRNRLESSSYPAMIATIVEDHGSAIRAKWSTTKPVGGVSVIEDAVIKTKPLRIQLDNKVVEKLLDFAFPIQNRGTDNRGDDGSDSESDVSLELIDVEDQDQLSELDADLQRVQTLKGDSKKGNTFHAIAKTFTKKNQDNDDDKSANKRRFKLLRKRNTSQYADTMMERASNYQSIRYLRIHPVQLIISYKGDSSYSLRNFQDLRIHMPDILVENKTWTRLDLLMKIKREVLKTLVSQSGSLISNKLSKPKSFVEPKATIALAMELDKSKKALEIGNGDLIPAHRMIGGTTIHENRKVKSNKNKGRSSISTSKSRASLGSRNSRVTK